MAEALRYVRTAAELVIGDVVMTPTGRHALVQKHLDAKVDLAYCDESGTWKDGDEVALAPTSLRMVRRASKSPTGGFFRDGDAAKRVAGGGGQ
jgi:hypothetical protein